MFISLFSGQENSENIRLLANRLSATPIIGKPIISNSDYRRQFPDPCQIHLSDYTPVQLLADILGPRTPQIIGHSLHKDLQSV